MTDEEYYNHPSISNTDLGITESLYKSIHMGQAMPNNAGSSVFKIGRQIHSYFLEPEKFSWLEVDDLETFSNMISNFDSNPFCKWLLKNMGSFEVEKAHLFEYMGIQCKCKQDIYIPSHNWLIDLKSTICETREEFKASCEKYNYDRQGYFYSIPVQAQRVTFLAISKVAGAGVFIVDNKINSKFMEGSKISKGKKVTGKPVLGGKRKVEKLVKILKDNDYYDRVMAFRNIQI